MDGFGRKLGRLSICDNEALKEAAHVCVCVCVRSGSVRDAGSANLTLPRVSLNPYGVHVSFLSPAHDLTSPPRN